MNNSRKILIGLGVIFILALAARVIVVLNTDSYWFDEVVSLEIAKKGIVESWQYLRNENNPPLHYWFLHFWVNIFGDNEKAVRMSSVLFGVLDVLAIYLLAEAMTKKKVAGLAAAFLVTCSSFQIYLSMDARMYAMLAFFVIMSCYFFWQIISNTGSKYFWFMYLLMSLAALYIHLTAIFVLIAQNLFIIFYHKMLKWQQWIWGQLLILFFYSPWLYCFISGSIARLNADAWYFNTSSGQNGFYLIEMPTAFLILGQRIMMIELVVIAVFLILVAVNFISRSIFFRNEKKWEIFWGANQAAVLALILFLLPLGVGFILQLWVAKYFMVSALGLYLLMAMGFEKIIKTDRSRIICAGIMLIIFLPFAFDIGFSQGGYAWHKVAQYIKETERPGDKIFSPAFVYELPLRYYYREEREIISLAPDTIEKDVLLRAVKYNWAPLAERKKMSQVKKELEEATRVMVVYPVVPAPVHRAEETLDWFIFNGWCLEERKQFGGFEQPAVFTFVNPKSSEMGECERKNAEDGE